MADIALAVLVFLPLMLTYFLKSNAAMGFIVLCVGFVLSTSVIGDLKHLLSQTNLTVTNDTLAVILIALPLLLTLLLTRHGHSRGPLFIAQLAAALAAGALLALSIGPLITSTQFDVTSSGAWKDLTNVQAAVIGIGSLISLLLIWAGDFRHAKKH